MKAMTETWIQCLGPKYPPKKGMATYSSICACRIPWREEHSGLQFLVSHTLRIDTTEDIIFSPGRLLDFVESSLWQRLEEQMCCV